MNVQVNHLPELAPAIDAVGDALGRPDLAAAANRQIAARFERIARRVAGLPPVPTLLILGPDRETLAGPGTYLDDLLQQAGGTNVAAGLGQPWPRVDRELLASLHPAVIIELSPGAKPAAAAVPLPARPVLPDRRPVRPPARLAPAGRGRAVRRMPAPDAANLAPSPGR